MKIIEVLLPPIERFLPFDAARFFVLAISFALVTLATFSNSSLAQQNNFSSIDSGLASQFPLPLEVLQLEFSPYDYRLEEPLNDMALRMQEANDHEAALKVFKKVWQVNRVNNGLLHKSQLALLENMISSERELGDWEAVSKHYAHLELLYRRLYDMDDPQLESGLQKISAWYVSAINMNRDGKRMEHLRKAHQIFKLRLQIAELTLAADDPKFAFLHESIAVSEHQLYMANIPKEVKRTRRRTQRDRLLAGLD
ncbi:MAG TPA: hypothetical protein QGF41_15785 [Gammaproteobacteria bacterium]|nr:hypothetical protein [Gammaproteobacteria bacterium]|tara:strand:+ start:16858 stop:17619 length:762 start_codon:yes stop_codon:yes gene_type:complete